MSWWLVGIKFTLLYSPLLYLLLSIFPPKLVHLCLFEEIYPRKRFWVLMYFLKLFSCSVQSFHFNVNIGAALIHGLH